MNHPSMGMGMGFSSGGGAISIKKWHDRMGFDDGKSSGSGSGCGLGFGLLYSNVFRRSSNAGQSSSSSSAPANLPHHRPLRQPAPAPVPAAAPAPFRPCHDHDDDARAAAAAHRQSNQPSSRRNAATAAAAAERNSMLVRASSGNVMLYGSLGNLRAPGAVTPNRHDVLDYLPMTADERDQLATAKQPPATQKKKEAVLCRALSVREDPEELKKKGNAEYMAGNYVDAVDYYERAISIDPGKPAYWSNKAAALMAMGRLVEAVADCREAVRVDPSFGRAHHRLGTLYLRLGQGERAAQQYRLAAHEASPDDVSRALAVQALVAECNDAHRRGGWESLLRVAQAAVAAGADASPKLQSYQAEALLALHRPEEADAVLLAKRTETEKTGRRKDPPLEVFGAGSCAYFLATRALVDMAMGRLEEAAAASEEALRVCPSSRAAASAARRARAVASVRGRGNALFNAGRFREAAAAYEQGIAADVAAGGEEHPNPNPNATLLCNRAACRCKLGEWEAALRDCDAALGLRPSYSKARRRRAACNDSLQRWEVSVRDYEALLQETPGDEDLAGALAHAQAQLALSDSAPPTQAT